MSINENPYFDRIAIIGIGLLGGSIARAAKKHCMAGSVVGCGRNEERLRFALENGIADAVEKDPVKAVAGADLVIICTPVRTIPDMLRGIAGSLVHRAIVTDVGSTKTAIVREGESLMPDGVSFVGCHPMAGSEESGVEASTDTLFENAICVLTSSERTNLAALEKLDRFWRAMRARVMIMSPEEHDLLVAASSHLPHVVAYSLVRCVADVAGRHEKVLPLLAGGFRDTTRIASSSTDMWRDICMENSEFIANMMVRFGDTFKELAAAVRSGDAVALDTFFSDAKKFREELPAKKRGILEPENEIIVDVADRPGVIGEITGALGVAEINIRNINVQHVRELRGGTLSIILEKADDIPRAIEKLISLGFTARESG